MQDPASISMQENDPYLSVAEIELTEHIINSTRAAGRKSRSSDASNQKKCHHYLKLLGVLTVAVGLLIKLDVRVDKELSTSAFDKELKVKGIVDTAAVFDDNEASANTIVDWRYMRWQLNETIQDNCIAGYRIAANTTLTCGRSVAHSDVTYLTQQHEGVNYCAGVEFQPNSCVEPMFGYWKAPEGNLSEISPLPRRFGIESYNNDKSALPRCKTMEQYLSNGTISRSGQFFPPKWVQSADNPTSLTNRLADYDREYVPATCSSIPLSPFLWTAQASCQTTITMYGDSHIRNLFTATVFGLRGFEMFAEAQANKESKENGIIYSYEWRLYHDGTADDRFEFHGGTDLNNSTYAYTVAHCSCNSKVKRCLRIFFVWAPKFLDQRNKFRYVKHWETDLLIVEPGNSYESRTIIDQHWMADLNRQLASNPHIRIGILHFPWGQQPAEKRTEAIRLWVNNSSFGDRIAYMRQDEIIFEPALQGRATFHFACGLGRVNVVNDIIEAAEPCTDRQDYSQIRALTTVLFDAFLDKTNS